MKAEFINWLRQVRECRYCETADAAQADSLKAHAKKNPLAGGHSWHPSLSRSSSETTMPKSKIRETQAAAGARTILEVKQLVLAMVKWKRSKGIGR